MHMLTSTSPSACRTLTMHNRRIALSLTCVIFTRTSHCSIAHATVHGCSLIFQNVAVGAVPFSTDHNGSNAIITTQRARLTYDCNATSFTASTLSVTFAMSSTGGLAEDGAAQGEQAFLNL
jgi:hypothetical protein